MSSDDDSLNDEPNEDPLGVLAAASLSSEGYSSSSWPPSPIAVSSSAETISSASMRAHDLASNFCSASSSFSSSSLATSSSSSSSLSSRLASPTTSARSRSISPNLARPFHDRILPPIGNSSDRPDEAEDPYFAALRLPRPSSAPPAKFQHHQTAAEQPDFQSGASTSTPVFRATPRSRFMRPSSLLGPPPARVGQPPVPYTSQSSVACHWCNKTTVTYVHGPLDLPLCHSCGQVYAALQSGQTRPIRLSRSFPRGRDG